MALKARYVHTNLIARDWKRLLAFYEDVLGCVPLPPERDLTGPWLDAATGVPGARVRGIHMRLPGHGEAGPTIEILQYDRNEENPGKAVNRPGFGHIAFAVDDVETALEAVIEAGGNAIGELVTVPIQGIGTLTFVYATDPEGNVIELQRWSP